MATNVNITEPPEFLRSYYSALAQRGMDLGNKPFAPYMQQKVAPWNAQQDMAAQMAQQRALRGSPQMQQANQYFSRTMNGDFLNNNPYLNNQINQAQDNVQSRINSQFGKNAFGGTAHQQTLARELGNVDTNMRGQQYQFDRGLQQQALQFAPVAAANDYADANALMGVGSQLQSHNQNIANANYGEFMRQQEYPSQQMAWMSSGLNPATSAFRNSSAVTDEGEGSSTANALGGALAGYSVGSYFDNPWLGAAAGGLLGYFM